MKKYEAVGVLPNLNIGEPIDAGPMMLVPSSGRHVAELGDPVLDEFLGRFRDTFGRRVRPSVLLRTTRAGKKFRTSYARSSFRDAVALSIIPYGWSQLLCGEDFPNVVWGDYFAVYPWFLSRDPTLVVSSTLAANGLDELKSFRGQSSPDLFPQQMQEIWIDTPLLAVLLSEWRSLHAVRSKPTWPRVALFRSLNMALRASKMPASVDANEYDIGASTALWVAAFEILAHPGPGGDVRLSKVYELLERTPWHLPDSKASRYLTFEGRGRVKRRRCAACWVYGELYRARNDYLHGAPVRPGRLTTKKSKHSLFLFAAPLYRLALTSFLQLKFTKQQSRSLDLKQQADFGRERARFVIFQAAMERALLEAHKRRAARRRRGR